jgi:hypothetical protein
MLKFKVLQQFVLLAIVLLLVSPAPAQTGLFNPIPKSVNIDLANVNAKEYKARIKQYKDTLRSLGRLEKQALVRAKKELNSLPLEDKHKTRLKTLKSDFQMLKARYDEIESMGFTPDMVRQAYRQRSAANGGGELAAGVEKVRKDSTKIAAWMSEQPGLGFLSDSSLSFQDKLGRVSAVKDQLPMDELGIDTDQYLQEYKAYEGYLGEGKGILERWKSDSTLAGKYRQATGLTDRHFGSYENYTIAREKLTAAEGLLADAENYRSGIQGILNGDTEQADQFVSALEARAMKIAGMREAADELGKLEGYEASIRNQIEVMRYKADLQQAYEKHLKGKDSGALVKEALMKGQEIGGGHFEGQEQLLSSAQQQLSSLKSGGLNFGNAENMEIIKPNSLQGKGLGKRLVIGGNLQISRQEEHTGIDFSPVLGYRWNKRYMWGLGGTYRAKINEDEGSVVKGEQVYGGRFYMEYSLLSKFFLHGEYELMSQAIVDPHSDMVRRVNAPGAMIGAGIHYSFMRNIKGSVMVLYNFLHDPPTSPYKEPFMFRFGFNLDK